MIRPRLSNAAARAHFLDRHGLLAAPVGAGRGNDLAEVIGALGFVQVDSVNTLARAHDLILWSRRPRYRPPELDRLLAGRRVFEHWTHDAAVLPIEAFPHWRLKFDRDRADLDRRWPASRREGWHHRMDGVLKRIAEHGPVTSAEVGEGEEKGGGGWWDWHPSKTALEYLWRSGELAITRREGFRKVYDLTERVIPPEWLNRRTDPGETVDWAMAGALDRLGFSTVGEVRAFQDLVTPGEATGWVKAALADGRIEEIEVQTADGRLRRCLARPGLAEEKVPEAAVRVRVLSPFDPALRDRARTERLFGFRYRIEIFVPAERRRYGYYVFPVWEGLRAVGRIDMKREEGCLAVRAFWPETGVSMGPSRRARLMAELERVARLGGCGDLRFDPGWLRG